MKSRYVALLLALILTVASCSDDKKPKAVAKKTTTTAKATTTAVPGPAAPLTGIEQPDAAIRNQPAVIVKIDNVPKARPQWGIDVADLIYEERVEGGQMRFIAIFHSNSPEKVGPIRSLRSTDPPIIAAVGGLFSYSGGIPPFVAKLHALDNVRDVGADRLSSDVYPRDRSRSYAQSMHASVNKLRSLAPGDPAPAPQFVYVSGGGAFNPAGAIATNGISVALSTRTSLDWTWEPATRLWRRTTNGTPHLVEGGAQLGFRNVVIQFVDYTNTGAVDVTGAQVDEARVIGNGSAVVMADGKRVDATWTKGGPKERTIFRSADGVEIAFAPGATWVTLAPAGAPTSVR